eukprot:CAMPEP_0113658048 /NCGR_PEP_ID=MMETSP0017_2-20120614/31461_1 /TAXON_ID=2856 /ORGANISM="Cylindrotheca closterium" /LENGTH=653 /DNA_ID=CAMNT_0000572195 /DNA_START=51 /DNA_END=2012 /DNA_ORIENTATION=+ /assembly_acc=CAM_ASM_000147
MSLTADGIRTIVSLTSSGSNKTFKPVFQLISIKAVGNKNGVQRYRAVLSDGSHFVQGMLATQLNHMVQSNEIQNNTVISVEDFMNNSVQGRNVIILLKITVVDKPETRIGSPTDIEKADSSPAPAFVSSNAEKSSNMPSAANSGKSTNVPRVNPYSPTDKRQTAPIVYSNMPSAANSGKSTNVPRVNPYSPTDKRQTAPIVHQASSSSSGNPITLIAQLNMFQNRWTIKARVVSKSEIRTWSNARGEGSLFSIELLDSSGMDIKATMFKEAVDKFYNLIEVGQVIRSGGRIKVANLQYNTCKSQFELNFDQNSIIRLEDDTGDIQAQSFDLVKISDLEKAEVGKNVDIIAVVQEIGDVQTLTSKKSGRELQKCDLTLIDDSGVQVRLTLWGNQASNAKNDIVAPRVVAFRKTRVGDFGGVSLSGASGFFLEPKIPETEALMQWWESEGSSGGAVRSLSKSSGGGGKMALFQERKGIADIKKEGLGYNNEKGDYLSFKAHFTFLKKDKEGGAWYTACPNKEDPCRNRCKVVQTTDGNWQCDRCQGTYPNCSRKWIFSGTVADDTGSTWVSVFDDQAMTLFGGTTADDAFAQYDNQDVYDSHFAKAMHTEWILKCRVKQETVNDEARLKTQIVRMDPVDYVAECRDLLSAIQKVS